ncbi:MAG: response regulator [bacterium]|nr:response regulator [bacterium]MDZ4232077.1 response regulator [Candidatus Pacearchaeota archaeon]
MARKPTKKAGKAKKILIVEDEEMLATMYADRFVKEGWKVTVAPSRDEGLAAAQKVRPDIVLLDILLFDGHGTEFLRRQKESKAISNIPVLVFSNLDDPQTRKDSLELGALEYLLKTDYTPQRLVEKVRSYLNR